MLETQDRVGLEVAQIADKRHEHPCIVREAVWPPLGGVECAGLLVECARAAVEKGMMYLETLRGEALTKQSRDFLSAGRFGLCLEQNDPWTGEARHGAAGDRPPWLGSAKN
jgi:hypothetical protein